jgi:hypothetical protein
MLLQAAAASCSVVESFTVVALRPSLSARRDSERASRKSMVITFADGLSVSAMPLILHSHHNSRTETNLVSWLRPCSKPLIERFG